MLSWRCCGARAALREDTLLTEKLKVLADLIGGVGVGAAVLVFGANCAGYLWHLVLAQQPVDAIHLAQVRCCGARRPRPPRARRPGTTPARTLWTFASREEGRVAGRRACGCATQALPVAATLALAVCMPEV